MITGWFTLNIHSGYENERWKPAEYSYQLNSSKVDASTLFILFGGHFGRSANENNVFRRISHDDDPNWKYVNSASLRTIHPRWSSEVKTVPDFRGLALEERYFYPRSIHIKQKFKQRSSAVFLRLLNSALGFFRLFQLGNVVAQPARRYLSIEISTEILNENHARIKPAFYLLWERRCERTQVVLRVCIPVATRATYRPFL